MTNNERDVRKEIISLLNYTKAFILIQSYKLASMSGEDFKEYFAKGIDQIVPGYYDSYKEHQELINNLPSLFEELMSPSEGVVLEIKKDQPKKRLKK